MKKLKIKLLSSGDYGFTIEGKTAVKKLMMDKETAQIDLLVRESIQNSSDAIKKESRFCIIKYNLKDFNNFKLSNCFENYKDSFVEKYGEGNYKALIITDLFLETEVVLINALPNVCMIIIEKLKKNLKIEKLSASVTLIILV